MKSWAIIAYARLSDEDGNKSEYEKSRSVENQIKYLEQYIESMKVRGENVTGYTVIFDDGQSGTDTDRKGFMRALNLLKSKEYNCLLISDLSRGFRNISDQTYYLEEYFPVNDIRFISTSLQYVDSYLQPESAMNLGVKIQGITNEQFAYDTSIKIRSKFDLKRRLGEFIGAFAPYGYDKHPDNSDILVVDDEAAEVVKDIFRWLTEDLVSQGAIVRKLNKLGIPNPTKYKNQKGLNLRNPAGNDGLWSASSVRRILTNEVYLGKMVQGREETVNYKVHKSRRIPEERWYRVEGTHAPIIDAETFYKAQDLLALNARGSKKGIIFPLGGLLKCGECKKAMCRKSSKNNVYYCCRTYREKGKQFCRSHSIREDTLFDAVLEALNYQILQMEDMNALIHRIKKTPKQSDGEMALNAKIKSAEKNLNNEIHVFDKTYYDYTENLISMEQFIRIRKICEKRQRELKLIIDSLNYEKEEQRHVAETKPVYYESFFEKKRIAELTRAAAFDLIESVYVYCDNSVEVNFKFADPCCVYYSRQQARM